VQVEELIGKQARTRGAHVPGSMTTGLSTQPV
jgi:hypothetical protein